MSKNNRDFSMQSFWAACVASGIGYIFVAGILGIPSGSARYILIYILSFAVFIFYLRYRRSKVGADVKLDGDDYLSAFLGSAFAQWAAVILMLFFGNSFDNNFDDNNNNEYVYYQNCSDARAHGVSRIHSGEPGYRAALDRDGDGVACE